MNYQDEQQVMIEIEKLKEQIRTLTEDDYTHEQEEEYNDMLDQCYEPWKFNGAEYMPSDILKECDPVTWRCGMNDYFNGRLGDLEYELESLEYHYQQTFGDDSDE